MDSVIVQMYPSADKLTKVTTTVHCPEEDCSSVFTSESNLNMHLAKTHKKPQFMKSDSVQRQYHCPETGCVYNGSLFFKSMKLLKQHFLKMHGEKKFLCDKCSKGFPTMYARKSHADYCGASFKCFDCEVAYPCYETLRTHCRRKKHSILEKTAFKEGAARELSLEVSKSDSKVQGAKTPSFILPKFSSSVHMLVLPSNHNGVDRYVQTLRQKESGEPKNTCAKERQMCVETQTIGDYITVATVSPNTSDDSLNKTSIETQTKRVNSETKSCSTNDMGDFAFNFEPMVQRSSSGTQTVSSKSEHGYTSPVNTNSGINFGFGSKDLTDFESTFFNCNIETQTDLFDDELLNDCDYYSNMYTQTQSCEDILLDGLEFNDTYTQTVFDDVVRSVESQTILHHSKRTLISCRGMANMETQTDAEIKQMLEELNA